MLGWARNARDFLQQKATGIQPHAFVFLPMQMQTASVEPLTTRPTVIHLFTECQSPSLPAHISHKRLLPKQLSFLQTIFTSSQLNYDHEPSSRPPIQTSTSSLHLHHVQPSI
jgi:hypothetical protein